MNKPRIKRIRTKWGVSWICYNDRFSGEMRPTPQMAYEEWLSFKEHRERLEEMATKEAEKEEKALKVVATLVVALCTIGFFSVILFASKLIGSLLP